MSELPYARLTAETDGTFDLDRMPFILAASDIFRRECLASDGLHLQRRTYRWSPYEGSRERRGWNFVPPLPIHSVEEVRTGESALADGWSVEGGLLRLREYPVGPVEADVISGFGTLSSIGTSTEDWAADATVPPASVVVASPVPGQVIFGGNEVSYYDGTGWTARSAAVPMGTEFHSTQLPSSIQIAVRTIASKTTNIRKTAGNAAMTEDPLTGAPVVVPSLTRGVHHIIEQYRRNE